MAATNRMGVTMAHGDRHRVSSDGRQGAPVRTNRESGAAAIEFAFLLPLLVMLAFGIIEFSTAYNRSQGMEAAVREGARLASTGNQASPPGIQLTAVQARVWNSLLGFNNSGAGYPAPGGTIAGDVVVEVWDLSEAQFTTLTDADETNNATGTSSAVACAGTFAVRVVGYVTPAREPAYGLTLPLVPGSPYPLSMRSEAVFRCIG